MFLISYKSHYGKQDVISTCLCYCFKFYLVAWFKVFCAAWDCFRLDFVTLVRAMILVLLVLLCNGCVLALDHFILGLVCRK